MNTVRKRAIKYLLGLKQLGYENELPLEQAKTLFSQIVDVWDRITIKAYFGSQAHRSRKQIAQRTNYASGTVSQKTIELTQDIAASPGYLQKMGLVSYSLKGHTWFMTVENSVLIPQLMKAEEKSIENLSLSHTIHQYVSENRSSPEGTLLNIETKEIQTNNNIQDERYKFGKWIQNRIQNDIVLKLPKEAEG